MLILTREWLTRTLRNKELKILSLRERELPSVETNSTLCSKSPINWLVMPRLKESKFQAQLDFPISIYASAAEDLLAVRDQRHGITGRWLSSKDILILNAQLGKWKMSHQSLSPTELKSALILELPHDCQYIP